MAVGVVQGALQVSLTLHSGATIALVQDVEAMMVLDDDNQVLESDQVAIKVDPFADPDEVDRTLEALWLTVTTLADALNAAVIDAVAPTLLGVLNTTAA